MNRHFRAVLATMVLTTLMLAPAVAHAFDYKKTFEKIKKGDVGGALQGTPLDPTTWIPHNETMFSDGQTPGVIITNKVRLVNTTNSPIHYSLLRDGDWKNFTLQPGHYYEHWNSDWHTGQGSVPTPKIAIKFDWKFGPGFQPHNFNLPGTVFRGKTDPRVVAPKVYNFRSLADGSGIELYAAAQGSR